ncbi:MAG: helix-turn-helix domain-containing protein [Deltaproteobacteria bacterium]|nr:helix-turn-helix domain-containing protein [Deltaproteobacteria bacterium]
MASPLAFATYPTQKLGQKTSGETMEADLEVVLTPDEVADILRLSVRTIIGGICRKTLPWIKVGGSLRMSREALMNYIKEENNGHLLERKSEMLGVRVSKEQKTLLRPRLPNKESSRPRRRGTPRDIEEWEA